ncbi:hypothetical protein TrispH2_006917 [Trichoplax sp. H2]|nr:hypothetical protein TrispH2_006917 [Trichoplax sp. H2]|eukprot:RDD41296.1 hypothetical protein TrispH2_006917 [Trichoplax sp. H2]
MADNTSDQDCLQGAHAIDVLSSANQQDSRRMKFSKLKVDGLKRNFHGIVYQLGLLTLAAWRARQRNYPFYLCSEATEFEKFDDLVIDSGDSITFLQAKHASVADSYSAKDFCAGIDQPASLAKYFDSWMKLRNGKFAVNNQGNRKTCYYIFFTNRDVKESDHFLIDCMIPDENEYFRFKKLPRQPKTVKFKTGQSRQQFINAIYNHSKEMEKYKATKVDIKDAKIKLKIVQNGQSSNKQLLIRELQTEIENAATALSKYLTDWYPSGKKSTKRLKRSNMIECNGKYPISNKAGALIQLALTKESWKNILLKKMNDQSKKLFKSHKTEISTKINSPELVIAGILDQEINQYLDEFIIKLMQPDVSNLLQIILEEIQLNVHIAPRQLYHALMDKILNWFRDRQQFVLKADKFGNLVQAEMADLERFYLLGDTQQFEKEYESYNISWTNFHNLPLYDLFLTQAGNGCPLAIITGIGLRPRVYATINLLYQKNFIHGGDWAFLTMHPSLKISIPKVFAGESIRFIVIDCLNWSDNDFLPIVEPILQAAISNRKLLVLLVEDDYVNTLKKTLGDFRIGNSGEGNSAPTSSNHIHGRENQSHKFQHIIIDTLTAKEIESVCTPFLDHYVVLSGKRYPLATVLKDQTSNLRKEMGDFDTLCDIIDSLVIDAQSNLESGLPYDVYIPNNAIQGVPVYNFMDLITNTNAQVIILNNTNAQKRIIQWFEAQFNRENIIRFVKNPIHIRNDTKFILIRNTLDTYLGQLNQCGYVYENVTAIFIGQGTGSIRKCRVKFISVSCTDTEFNYATVTDQSSHHISLPKPVSYYFNDNDNDNKITLGNKLIDHQPTHSIVLAKAGCGKTSLCLNIKYRWFQQKPSKITWMIYVHLPQLNLSSSPTPDSIFTKLATDIDWKSWELSALAQDMKTNSNVTLLLDGFDEIKDENQAQLINQWINDISDKVQVVITSRCYAANKISLTKNVRINSYKLLEYTDSQRAQYIEEYVKAILRMRKVPQNELDHECIQVITQINKYLNSISNRKSKSLLGIPLESYLFCEILIPSILSSKDKDYDRMEAISTATLLQQFIRRKLLLFLYKHMNINETTVLPRPQRIYALTSSYFELCLVFAFRQAFHLPYKFIGPYLYRSFKTDAMIQDLNDTGLLSVYNHGQHYFKFSHETYQEYFAALFALREIVSDDQLSKNVKNILQKHRYNPKYMLILSLAAQLSMTGDDLIPRFDSQNDNHQLALWKVLFDDDSDILGAAKTNLAQVCFSQFSTDHRQILETKLKKETWGKQVLQCLRQHSSTQNLNDGDAMQDGNVNFSNRPNQVSSKVLSDSDLENVKTSLKNKNLVEDYTKKSLETICEAKIAQLFEEIITDTKINSYWDIDGGFAAMALLGNAFNTKLADYFIKRIDEDARWRANSALSAIHSLYHENLEPNAKHACLKIMPYFIKHQAKLSSTQNLISIIKSAHSVIFNDFLQLHDCISKISLNYLIVNEYEEYFKHPILIFRSLLWIAMKIPYAVNVENDEIQFIYESNHCLKVGNGTQSQIFKELQKIILIRLKSGSDKQTMIESNCSWANLLDDEHTREYLERSLYPVLAEKDDLSSVPDKLMNDGDLAFEVYSKISGYELINENTVNALVHLIENYKNRSWPREGGIDAVSYVGKYFNKQFAEFFIERAKLYTDNAKLCETALTTIKETLEKIPIHERDQHYDNAVSVYDKYFPDMHAEIPAYR